jgi:hypothetical protein
MPSKKDAKRHRVTARAEKAFANADKQRAHIKANPKEAVRHAHERVRRVKKR